MKNSRLIFFVLALWLICCIPVTGVTTYVGGSPLLSAALSGTNEFTPGQDATIFITVQNSGVNSLEFVTTGTITRDDLPTTAKLVTLELSAGDVPVVVKSDPQNVGDLKSPGLVTVPIRVKILPNATGGNYQILLNIVYSYLGSSTQDAADVLEYNYKQVNETIPVTIKIKPQLRIEVSDAGTENLTVGSEGFLNLKIKNAGSEDGKKASVTVIRNGASPIIPTDNSVFIGDFPANGVVTGKYKVAVSNDAENQIYPVDIIVTYENREGDVVTSTVYTVGVPVGRKISFGITSPTVHVLQGSEGMIEVEYQNNGDSTAYQAQARLSIVEPFQSSDDTAYLGDLKPGQKVTARFHVSTADTAVVKEYSLSTEIRYHDSLDNSQVSDPFNVTVDVESKPLWGGVVQVLVVIGVIILVGIGAGYYLLVMRKKK